MDPSASSPPPPPPPPPPPYSRHPPGPVNQPYRSLLSDLPPPLPPLPSPPHLSRRPVYTPAFVPGLPPHVDPVQHLPFHPQPFIHHPQKPEWQPDSQVSSCPLCNTLFGLFYRRHHCRKCGRVVCATCSGQSMHLPHSSVVRPPGEDAVMSPAWAALLSDSSSSSGGGLSGLTSVNARHSWAASPTSPTSPQQGEGGFFDWVVGGEDGVPVGWKDVRVCRECFDVAEAGPSNSSAQTRPSQEVDTPNRRRRRGESFQGGRSVPLNYAPSFTPNHHSHQPHHQHIHGPPRPKLKETDYCPICTAPLPPIGPNNDESAREAHIEGCIRRVEASTSPSPPSDRQGTPQSSHPGAARSPVRGRPQRSHSQAARMLVYNATEADELDADGERQECVICLEEFEKGEKMARLECLCRYHWGCIVGWLEKRRASGGTGVGQNGGDCPVHAMRE